MNVTTNTLSGLFPQLSSEAQPSSNPLQSHAWMDGDFSAILSSDIGTLTSEFFFDGNFPSELSLNDLQALIAQFSALFEDSGIPKELVPDLESYLVEIEQTNSSVEFVAVNQTLLNQINELWSRFIDSEQGLVVSSGLKERFEMLKSVLTGVSTAKVQPRVVPAGGASMALPGTMPVLTESLSGASHKVLNLTAFHGARVSDLQVLTPSQLMPAVPEQIFTPQSITTSPVQRMEFIAQVLPREAMTVESLASRLSPILGDKIKMQFSSRAQDSVATVRLDPPELGRIDIRLRVDSDRVSVSLVPSGGQAREAIESSLDKLRTDLLGTMAGLAVDVAVEGQSHALLWEQDSSDISEGGTTETNTENEFGDDNHQMEGVIAKA